MIETGNFTVYATFLAQHDRYDQMQAICRESFDLTKATPGLKQVICLEPPKPEQPFVFVSIWQSRSDFQAFLQTPAMHTFHSKTAIQKMFDTAMQAASADFYTVMDAWSSTP
jgi:quinol monooxygenase YgiN